MIDKDSFLQAIDELKYMYDLNIKVEDAILIETESDSKYMSLGYKNICTMIKFLNLSLDIPKDSNILHYLIFQCDFDVAKLAYIDDDGNLVKLFTYDDLYNFFKNQS